MKRNEYFEKLNKKPFEQLSNEDINELFNDLLNTLPNKGRLYKYRNFEDEQFNKTLDSLKEKYLWIADAEDMKDKRDARLNVDYQSDMMDLKKFVLENPYVAFASLYKNNPNIQNQLTSQHRRIIEIFIKNINSNDGKVSFDNLVDSLNMSGMSRIESNEMAKRMVKIINDSISEHTEEIEKSFNDILKITERIRKDTKIFSMSGSHNNNFMWDDYSKGNGFCIEYDFNKACIEKESIKRLLLRCFKVKYYKQLKKFSLSKILMRIVLETADKDFYSEQERLVYEQMISKLSFYSSEDEWRILQYKGDNKLFVNIVSSIIIDENGKETERAKELIDLARENNWSIKYRRFNKYINDYIYENDDYQ
ncbi:MAG: DUF2971 domain-containing protein [Bacilli bacterium]|nr:DUF2971 domain-containing protein [Bacilli bacterium]